MSCETVRPALLEYHFGLQADSAERAALEAHLPGCAACVREFVALKRAVELADPAARPSDVAKARLRAAVIEELRGRSIALEPRGPRRRWDRPVAFACAIVLTMFAMAATQAITSGPGAAPLELISE